jgi:hypothetical protein
LYPVLVALPIPFARLDGHLLTTNKPHRAASDVAPGRPWFFHSASINRAPSMSAALL